jgi:hypothetical protein
MGRANVREKERQPGILAGAHNQSGTVKPFEFIYFLTLIVMERCKCVQ